MKINTEVDVEPGEWIDVQRLVLPFTSGDEAESLGFVRLQGAGGRRRWVAATTPRMAVLDAGVWNEDVDVGVPGRAVSSAVALSELGSFPQLSLCVDEVGSPAVFVRDGNAEVELPGDARPFPGVDALIFEAQAEPQATAIVSASTMELLVSGAREMPPGVRLGPDDDGPLFWVEFGDGQIAISVNWGPYGTARYSMSADVVGSAAVAVNPMYLHEFCGCLVAAAADDEATLLVRQGSGPLVLSAGPWSGFLMPLNTTIERFRPALEQMLRDLGLDEPQTDQDGDYPIAVGSGGMYVRLAPADPQRGIPDRVQVFAVVLDGVEPSPELLAELNDLNGGAGFARVFHVSGQVLVEVELLVHTLDLDELDNAFRIIGGLVNDLGPWLEASFG